MNSDPSSLSAEPFIYFLLHSSLFVMAIAAVFGALGLYFGWLTWGKYRLRLRESIAEREGFKTEIAGLKRKLAELATRLSQQQPENAADAPPAAPASIGKSDPVIGSFLATASSLLSRQAAMPEPARRLGLPVGPSPLAKPGDHSNEEPAPTEDDRPGDSVLNSLIHGTAQVQVNESGDGDSAGQTSTASPQETGTPREEPAQKPFPLPVATTETAPPGATTEPGAAGSRNGSSAPGEPGLTCDPQLGMIYLAAPAQADDLTHLKGVASVIEGRLNEFGVYTFRQIAVWSDENVREFSSRLAFKDRIFRENWRDQARELHFQKYGERL